MTWLNSTRKSQRNIEIFEERLGLISGQRKTLEEVGKSQFNITRERVRQITRDFLRRLSRPYAQEILAPIHLQLRQLFKENDCIMTLNEAREKINFTTELEGFSSMAVLELILYCCDLFSTLDYDYESGRGVSDFGLVTWYLKTIKPKFIQMTRKLALDYIDEKPCHYTFEELVSRISSEAKIPIETTRASLRTCNMIEQDPSGLLVRAGKYGSLTITNMALIALREIGVPAHFTTITKRINERFPGRNLKSNHVHNYLMNPLFRWVDRGTYGLAEWGLPEIRPKENYAAGKEAIRAALRAIGEPATITEIQEYLNRTPSQNADFMFLSKPRITLVSNPQLFVNLGRNRWGLREWGMIPTQPKDTTALVRKVLDEEEIAWLTAQQLYLEMKSRGWLGTIVALQRALERESNKIGRRIRKEELHGFDIQLYGLSSSDWNEQVALAKLLAD